MCFDEKVGIKIMTENDKLDILYKYQEMDELSKEQIKQAIRLTRDKSSLVRLEAAECLFQEYPTTARVLMRLAKDRNELVRVSAYETLGLYSSEAVEIFLKNAMNKERKALALSYCIGAWGDVAVVRNNNIREKLAYLKQFEKKRKVQKSDGCILECQTIKYLMGEKDALEKLLKYIYHPDFHLRICAIEDLEYICNADNKEKIILYLKKALNDPVRAVSLLAKKYIEKIQNN